MTRMLHDMMAAAWFYANPEIIKYHTPLLGQPENKAWIIAVLVRKYGLKIGRAQMFELTGMFYVPQYYPSYEIISAESAFIYEYLRRTIGATCESHIDCVLMTSEIEELLKYGYVERELEDLVETVDWITISKEEALKEFEGEMDE